MKASGFYYLVMAKRLIKLTEEEKLKEFLLKESILEGIGEEVSPYDFYEDLFVEPEEVVIPVVFIEGEGPEGKHMVSMTVFDAMERAKGRSDVLIGSCSYFNDYISKQTCKTVYGFILDMDDVFADYLLSRVQSGWCSDDGDALPLPTYIVNSGTGLHLVFRFTEPIPCYKSSVSDIGKVYRQLCQEETASENLIPQRQWFGQTFRAVGGLNKRGLENKVYRVGEPWDIDELGKRYGICTHFRRYDEPAKVQHYKYTDPIRYKCAKGFYTAVLNKCREKTEEGHRYTSMMAITAVAVKCGVPKEELRSDLEALVGFYNSKLGPDADRRSFVKEREIDFALKLYNVKARTITSETLESWTGYPFKRNNRHRGKDKYPRKKTPEMAANGDLTNIEVYAVGKRNRLHPDGSWRGHGPVSDKKDLIINWRKENPDGSKERCIRETGISRMTVYKWWKNED